MCHLASLIFLATTAFAQSTPVTGHYPPGQSGVRGAAASEPSIAYTNFNRFFTNLQAVDSETGTRELDELRYANISMITWTSPWEIAGLRYAALAGIPFATGDLSSPTADSGFGLGDILVTPISLTGSTSDFDGQFQLSVWTPSGHFSPGDARNRGTGFWALVYSLGGVWYPGGDRAAWSASAIARFEQNFEQRESGILPGDDVVVDWGVARMFTVAGRPLDVGVSGFADLQLTYQQGGAAETNDVLYRLFGAGPEASLGIAGPLSVRVRIHGEFGAHEIVRGNNVWIILNLRAPTRED
jgi:hypothetical protein